jgi:phage baseplate assembly protein gpV
MPNTVFTGLDPSLPASINGNVTFLDGVALDAALSILGNLTIQVGTFDLNGSRLDVGGTFDATGVTAVLRMASAADTLSIGGDVLFAGGSTDGQLTNGLLELLGSSLVVSGDSSAFAASGAHVTRFGAGNTQTVSFSSPGSGASSQHFANLVIAQSGAGTELRLLSDAFVDGTVASEPDNAGEFAALAPQFHVLTARGADLVNVAFQGVALALVDGAAIGALDSLTFYDQDSTVVQLSVTRPAGEFAMYRPTFATVPTTGRYLRVVDSNEGSDLIVSVTEPTPAGHGGFLETLSGASVTGWPASVAAQLALTTPAAGAASGLAFTTQPVVEVRDSGGGLVTGDDATEVTLTASVGATVIGTSTATAAGGVVTFSDVGLTGIDGTYDLTYSAAGLDSATQQILLGGSQAPVITWSGSVDNAWGNTGNWDLNRLPLPSDSVVINLIDTVVVTTAAQVGWLTVGESNAVAFTIAAGATLTVDSLATFGGTSIVTMTGGTLTGAGSATVFGTLNWSGGTMSGTGVTLIAAPATAVVTGGPTLNTRGLVVGGNVTLGGTAFNGSNVGGQTPTLVVLAGGTLAFTSTASYFSGSGIVELVNGGLLRKSASAGLVRVDWPITNTGTVDIEDDTLDLRNSLTHVSGTIIVGSNATLISNGDTDASGSINISTGGFLTLEAGGISADAGNHIFGPTSSVIGLGTLRINSADTTRIQGVLDIEALTVQNGNTWFEGPDTMYVTDGAYLGGGFFRGSGVLGIRGDFVLNAGNMVGTGGTLAVRPGATLALRGMNGWHVDVEGTATWGDYDMTFGQDTLNGVPYASLRVRSGGVLDVLHGTATPRELFGPGAATYPNVVFTIDAGATVRKSTGTGVSNFRPRLEMAGTFDVLSGSISIQGTCAMSGNKTGPGAVTGSCGSFP